jgi:ABC-type polar amino acid transport system ATPase subunit
MSRQRLITSLSEGKSEVLETLHYQGALRSGVQLARLAVMVSHRWGGDETTETGDPQFLEDVQSVVQKLAEESLVTGFDPVTGKAVNLASTQPTTANVILTGTGRAAARHPRPKPRYLRG